MPAVSPQDAGFVDQLLVYGNVQPGQYREGDNHNEEDVTYHPRLESAKINSIQYGLSYVTNVSNTCGHNIEITVTIV